jgi:hypothetical protein
MSNTTIAVWTIFWFFILLLLYRFAFNPQILIIPSVLNLKGCPDRWTYDGSMCTPNYPTSCKEFDPNKIVTLSEACNICKSCGTNWSGQCS